MDDLAQLRTIAARAADLRRVKGRHATQAATEALFRALDGSAPFDEVSSLLDVIYRIRCALGDPEGRLMLDDLPAAVESLRKAVARPGKGRAHPPGGRKRS